MDAPKLNAGCSRVGCLSGSGGELGAASLVAVEGEAVDHEGVAEEVEVLAGVADAVGASEPEGVVEVAVDGFGVVAAGVEPGEVGVGCGDGADVFGAVELPGGVVGVAVESDGDGLVVVAVGELVVVVPAVLAVLVAVAVGADAGEFGEGEVAGFGEFTDADGATAGVERDRLLGRPSMVMVLSSM